MHFLVKLIIFLIHFQCFNTLHMSLTLVGVKEKSVCAWLITHFLYRPEGFI